MRLYQKHTLLNIFDPRPLCVSLIKNRRLLYQFSRRNIEMQHKGSYLGLFWSALNPLMLFGIYAFVFIAIFSGRFGVVPYETKTDYAIGLFLGLALIQFYQETILISPALIVSNQNFVKKVVFPLEILPASAVMAALFRCLISLVLVVLAVMIWGAGLTVQALWMVPLLCALVSLALGSASLLSALGVFLRDTGPFIQFISVLLMFASAVFYSMKSIPDAFSFLRFNPLLVLVETSRGVLLWHITPDPGSLVYLGLTSLGVLICGHAAFTALRPAFSDVL